MTGVGSSAHTQEAKHVAACSSIEKAEIARSPELPGQPASCTQPLVPVRVTGSKNMLDSY